MKQNRGLIAGLTLIAVGSALYGLRYLDVDQRPLLFVALGGGLVALYFATRSGAALIAGCVTAGWGLGQYGAPHLDAFHESSRLGLAFGFAMIWVIRLAYERRSHGWPLIPAAVLGLLGFGAWGRFRRFVLSEEGWPILIVIAGALLVLGSLGRRAPKRS